MSLEEDTLVQENIQEFVHDDNKIVTCKWLSLTLSISVNLAKQALIEFVKKARNQGGNNDDINVTYFVSGFDNTEDDIKILKCIVVPESYLDSIKQSLDPVTSCHIYSVQKSQLKDYTPLYQADYDICRENIQALNKFSPITCPWAGVRDDQPISKQDRDSPVKKSSTDVTSSSSSSSTSVKKAINKKGGIASMFAAASDKKEKKPEKESKASAPKDTGGKKGIQSFMKAQPAGSKNSKGKEANVKKVEESNADQNKTNTSDSKKTDKAQKHKLSEKEEPQRQKKRRRIRNDLFDSSDEEKDKSDDDEEEESDEEERAVTPSKEEEEDDVKRGFEEKEVEEQEPDRKVVKTEADKAKVKDGAKGGKKRKRTRKLVPRQHIDEDGFMVTEKVWESDSTDASDQEEPAKTTKPVSPAKSSAPKPAAQNKKKTPAASPSKNKQMSLMSFFKKK